MRIDQRGAPRRGRPWFKLGRPLVLLALVVMLLIASLTTATALASDWPALNAPRIQSSVHVLPDQPAASPGLVVDVGLHIRNIYNLSLVDQSFLAEGWYWYRWRDELQQKFEQLRISPDDLIELANEIELGQYSVRDVSASSQVIDKPGTSGRIVRFSGKFFLADVPQRYAPFDPQELSIALEVQPEAFALASSRVQLKPDNSPASIVGEDLEISGYQLDSVAWEQSLVAYPDDFLPAMRFSRAAATFIYRKSQWSMLIKWIFPILIVMAIVIVSPSIEGILGDIRIAIPPSALLTLVVMQDTYKNSFPPAPYLTYLDELYVYSYIVCLAIFLLFLVGTNLVARASEDERDRVALRVNRIDTTVQISMVIGLVLVTVVGWFT
jgi:hypothetical protein